MSKAELLALVKQRRYMSIRVIHRHLGIDPTSEADRERVWRVGQNLAQLVREKHLHLRTSTGERVFYDF